MKSKYVNIKKFGKIALSGILVCVLCIPAVAFATDTASPTPSSTSASTTTPATNCRATLNYYSVINYQDSKETISENDLNLISTRTISGLTMGQTFNSWDYVTDIQNYIFFNLAPENFTISTSPDQNIVSYYYFQENNSFTVNYYIMLGADLTATNWKDALAPGNVQFLKIGSETFDNQPFGELVKGDAYAYKIDGAYVIDTYPAEIRVGSNADNNVLNVLYVPNSELLPSNKEINDNLPSQNTGAGTTNTDSSSATLPPDQTLSKNELTKILQSGAEEGRLNELFRDFLGTDSVDNTNANYDFYMSPQAAKALSAAYKAGKDSGIQQELLETNGISLAEIIMAGIILVLTVLAIIGFALFASQRQQNQILTKINKQF